MTSEVKRKATSPSLFDLPSHGLLPRAARSCGQRKGTQALDLQSGAIMLNAQALADRYVAAWNEPDAARRSAAVAALWAPDALGHRGAAGYAALTKLAPAKPGGSSGREGVRYRAAPTARLRGDVMTFRWEMLLADSETVLAGGLEFLIVDDDGRILADHPFALA
jgi:hypothetical protein